MITLSRSLIAPFLTFSDRRDLREQAFNAWIRRGENDGEHDNRPVAREILALRNEQARLHGYRHYADYALVDRMAGTPEAVARLFEQIWEPAKARAAEERDALREWPQPKARRTRSSPGTGAITPKRSARRVIGWTTPRSSRIFRSSGCWPPRSTRRTGCSGSGSSSARIFAPITRMSASSKCSGSDGDRMIGVFLSDNFARPTKRGGAWMSAYRWQSRVDGETLPIIVNNNNFAKAPAGEPTLLSADDVRTLFHEFGHGLHGLLSNVTYERLSGTHVLRDFVELPSQIFEHWAFEPAVLKRHALHHATNEPIPDALIERLNEARRFNKGIDTVEYTACALVDMALHARPDAGGVDITEFERAELERIGMPRDIVLRHRLPHFGHLFSGSSYAAGYYVYQWAEVLDADGYDAFVEAGDPFDPRLRGGCCAMCTRRAARCRRPRRTGPSAVAIHPSGRCSPSSDWPTSGSRDDGLTSEGRRVALDYLPQRSASGWSSPASSSNPARVAGCSASSGWRTASLLMTPPAAITVLVARSPHWRFS